MKEIQDSIEITSGGHFLNYGAETANSPKLPTYKADGLTGESIGLTLTDCHLAMESIMTKARLIGDEIAQSNRRFSIRRLRKVNLQGNAKAFDSILSSTIKGFPKALEIRMTESTNILCARMRILLKSHLRLNKDFKDSLSNIS